MGELSGWEPAVLLAGAEGTPAAENSRDGSTGTAKRVTVQATNSYLMKVTVSCLTVFSASAFVACTLHVGKYKLVSSTRHPAGPVPQTPEGLPPKAALNHEFTKKPYDVLFPNGTEVRAMSSARPSS